MTDPNTPDSDQFWLQSLDTESPAAIDPPAAQGDPPHLVDDPKPPASNKRRWKLAAVIAAPILVAGLAYYAWDTRRDRNDAEDALAAAQTEKQALSDALEIHRASSDDLGDKLQTCSGELEAKTQTAQEETARVVRLEANLAASKSQVVDLRKQRAAAKSKLAEFNALTRSFQSMINTGQLDVVFRNGQMIVKLPAKILFASGSAELSEAGKKALGSVAKILRKMGGRKFTVAGHTDNVAISTKEFGSNWELSAARAVSVLQTLTRRGVPPSRLVAAGFGPYSPISTNKTARGRQNNRRIEIILEPYLRKPPRTKKGKKTARKRK